MKKVLAAAKIRVPETNLPQVGIFWSVLLKYATTHNHPQPPKIIHNHPQPSTTTHNHPKNHPQPPKIAKTCHKQLCYRTLDVNTETDVDFDSDMKQWYTYMCVCLCVYALWAIIFTIFWLGWLFSIKSNSFHEKNDDFCLLKIWIYELLLINIKQRSVQQSTISAHELSYEFLRIVSIFREKFYCLSVATVAVDINVEALKENGILLSQFAQNVVEAHFLRSITGWDYLLGNWFKIKFPEIWLHFYMTIFP